MEEFSIADEETISRIADLAPRAMSAYLVCLYKSDSDGLCSFTRGEIIDERVRSWTKFKNDIRSLSKLFLLNFLDAGDSISIELIPQNQGEIA